MEHLNFMANNSILHNKQKKLIIKLGKHEIGGNELAIIAGPCSIESEQQISRIAKDISAIGAQFLRGGAYKPRSSPHSFQGIGEKGFALLASAARKNGMLSVAEVMDEKQLEEATDFIDIMQVGARNMQNFSLLKILGKIKSPILLKRGFAATYQEFLLAAEYILNAGNQNVILCERGIRTFEPMTRFTLDLNLVPLIKELTHLPIIVDPSHGTGIRSLVVPMGSAAIAAGACGLEIEVHYDPENSISDPNQAISLEQFQKAMPLWKAIQKVAQADFNFNKSDISDNGSEGVHRKNIVAEIG